MTPWARPEFRQALKVHLVEYAQPDDRRAVLEIGLTVVAYVAFLVLTTICFRQFAATRALGWFAAGLLSGIGLALLQVRAFLVHHDLCHQSLFTSRRANLFVAPLLGTLASTSSSVWSREHDRHHRDSNNLDRSQDGQTAAWTVAQYESAKPWQRRAYWLLNQRLVLFGLVPPLYFLGFMRVAARWYENVLFAGFVALLWWSGMLGTFFAVLVPATMYGFLIFHAQHTGPTLVRRHTAAYDFFENGLRGSTWLVMPRVPLVGWFIDWCLYGVQFHHVHHLHPAMPAWRQRACHEGGEAFFSQTPPLTLWEAIKATRLTLYDEASSRLVSFSERRQPSPQPSPPQGRGGQVSE
jgi:omega-6 fatty acid desaturase (delta-12 desaturase)